MELVDQYGPLLVEQLRDQINNLMAAAQLITPVIREQEDRRYDQYLAIMNQSLYRLLRLMNHFGYAQCSEEPVFSRQVLDLAGLCRQLSDQVAPLANEAGVCFLCDSAPNTLLLCGDEALLSRMLLNLISNAIRAAGEGGEVGLRLRLAGDRAAISVWDNGPDGALPGEDTREDTLLLHKRDGLGLGLPIARQIAALHGGTLVFEHREGRGTLAVISLDTSLPTKPEKPALHTPKLDFDASGGFSQVLVELSDVLPFQAFLPEDLE